MYIIHCGAALDTRKAEKHILLDVSVKKVWNIPNLRHKGLEAGNNDVSGNGYGEDIIGCPFYHSLTFSVSHTIPTIRALLQEAYLNYLGFRQSFTSERDPR